MKIKYTITAVAEVNPENYDSPVASAEDAAKQEQQFWEDGLIDIHDIVENAALTVKVEAAE